METANILKAVTNVVDHERHVISEKVVISKFLLVNPATSATGKRKFSMARRVYMVASEHHESTKVLSRSYIANQRDKHR